MPFPTIFRSHNTHPEAKAPARAPRARREQSGPKSDLSRLIRKVSEQKQRSRQAKK